MTDAVRFPHRHLLGIRELSRADIEQVLDLAASFAEIGRRPVKKVPTLRGKTVVNFFVESSTRTRTSFELAAKRLSADGVNISASTSALTKGETLFDTARTLHAMRPDVLVLRHSASGAPHQLASLPELAGMAIVNAGDGAHEHPTQALLDAFTLRERKGRVEGLTVAIVGDIEHSRVARSNVLCLTKLGASVRLCGPRTMLPPVPDALGVSLVTTELREAVTGADAVMMLRIQLERQAGPPLLPSLREYSRLWGLDAAKLAWAKEDAVVMHPGPMNRGVELDASLADGARSVILDQVENGVAVRMAVLYLLAGGGASPEASP